MTSTETPVVVDANTATSPSVTPAGEPSPNGTAPAGESSAAEGSTAEAFAAEASATAAVDGSASDGPASGGPVSSEPSLREPSLSEPDSGPSGDGDGSSGWWTVRRRRITGMAIWGVAFFVAWITIGIPTDPIEAFLWIWAATIAWNSHKPLRSHLLFLRDWAIVIVLLVVYNISRGWASTITPHITEMIHADQWLLGWATGGQIPTMWLQQHLYDPHHVHWYETLASFVYFSHFVMALIVAAVLWIRNRDRWLSFVRRWFTLTALILATYFLYPAAPPWFASLNGNLPGPLQLSQDGSSETVVRLSTRGWDAIGLHHAGSLLNAAQVQEANQVAAMPSMHSAYALMVIVFFLPAVRKRWWPLMLCYPLAMTFALVYSGEHYVIDVLMGWAYVGVTFVLVWAAEKGWAAFRARRRGSAVVPDTLPPLTDVPPGTPAVAVAAKASSDSTS